jgi:SM-20-related protein
LVKSLRYIFMDSNTLYTSDPAALEQAFDALADSLAEKGYALLDGFLSPEECGEIRAIIDRHEEEGRLKKAGIGTGQDFQVDRSIRGDLIRWIEPDKVAPVTQAYVARLQQLMEFLNRSLYLSLKDSELHYTMYPPGKRYQRHLDQFRLNDHRRLSVICYLNDDWQPAHGGELRLYLPDGKGGETTKDVLPVAGRFICFRSDLLEHEVLPTNRHRYSITGWLLDQLAELTHL